MKKSKVILAAFSRQWEGKYGIMYDHTVTFENLDTGTYTSKTQEQTKFIVGQEVEYETQPNEGYPDKIKPVNTFQQNGQPGGSNKWTADEVAQQDTIKLTVAAISAGLPLKHYKQFFVECKSFMLEQSKEATVITEQNMGMPAPAAQDNLAAVPVTPQVPAIEDVDDLPF